MNVVYWSDYACPYCYIGETNLRKAAEELGIEDLNLEMRAFELDPGALTEFNGDTIDRFADKYKISPQEALDRVNSISIMAQNSGIDFDYAKTKYTNTFNAHRLTKLAQELGKEEELAEKLYQAYFIEQKELANIETLIEVAQSVGISEEQVRELIDSDKYADQVRLEEQIAYNNGINAVPFFIINEQVGVPGALDKDQMKDLLKQIIDNQ